MYAKRLHAGCSERCKGVEFHFQRVDVKVVFCPVGENDMQAVGCLFPFRFFVASQQAYAFYTAVIRCQRADKQVRLLPFAGKNVQVVVVDCKPEVLCERSGGVVECVFKSLFADGLLFGSRCSDGLTVDFPRS